MRFFLLVTILFFIYPNLTIAQEWKGREDLPDDFPRPPKSEKSLFYIQRNKNYNTIVYDLNTTENGTIHPKDPIDTYWINYGDKVTKRELTWLEAWLAYGYRAKLNEDKSIKIKLRAHNERFITLRQVDDKWHAIIPINGEEAFLSNIYAYADESGIIPKVLHVDIYGIDVKSGKPVKERIFD